MNVPPVGAHREVLAASEAALMRRRQAQVDDLNLLLVWVDSHSGDPAHAPAARERSFGLRGGPRLITVGGPGTPAVQDLCFAEIAIAREATETTTRNLAADALDLRHRLPRVWACVQDLRCETWVATRIARMSRILTRDTIAIVDAAVAEAIDQSPGRLLAIAEAKVIEADHVAHRARVEANRRRCGVWFPKPLPGNLVDDDAGDAGVRSVFGRLDEGDAIELEAMVEDLADLLAEHGDYTDAEGGTPTRDRLRAESLGLLARPADALKLLNGTTPEEAHATGREQEAADGHHHTEATTRRRRAARLVVHIGAATLNSGTGVARVEHLGPMLTGQVQRLFQHARVQVLPVIDLREMRAVNGYEHPTDIRTRTELRTGGDVFPHSASQPGARVDHDHPEPYARRPPDKTGTAGQTGDHNDAPLTRRHHRAKTHLGYHLAQLGPGEYLWTTPHGIKRLVTPRGTHRIDTVAPAEEVLLDILDPPA